MKYNDYSVGTVVFVLLLIKNKVNVFKSTIVRKLGCEQYRVYRVDNSDYVIGSDCVSTSPRELAEIILSTRLHKETKEKLINKLKTII